MTYSNLQFLGVLLLAAVLFPLVPLLLARYWARTFSPAKPGIEKNRTYECGIEAKGDPMIRFRSEYALYAVLFLVMDVEAVLLLPLAVEFLNLPLGGMFVMFAFVALLVEGLAWAWMKGYLEYK